MNDENGRIDDLPLKIRPIGSFLAEGDIQHNFAFPNFRRSFIGYIATSSSQLSSNWMAKVGWVQWVVATHHSHVDQEWCDETASSDVLLAFQRAKRSRVVDNLAVRPSQHILLPFKAP